MFKRRRPKRRPGQPLSVTAKKRRASIEALSIIGTVLVVPILLVILL